MNAVLLSMLKLNTAVTCHLALCLTLLLNKYQRVGYTQVQEQAPKIKKQSLELLLLWRYCTSEYKIQDRNAIELI